MADTTITPTGFTYAPSLAVPSVGDQVKAATAPGAVRPAYQKLLNGMSAAQLQLYGQIAQRVITCVSNTEIILQVTGSYVLTDGGVWTVVDKRAVVTNPWTRQYYSWDPTAYITLNPNKRYWMFLIAAAPYAYFEEDTGLNGPCPDLFYGGSTDQLFLTSFYTDSAGDILKYEQLGRSVQYLDHTSTGGGVDGNLMLDSGNATSATDVSYTDAIPPYAQRILVDFEINGSPAAGSIGNTAAATRSVLYADGSTTTQAAAQVSLSRVVTTAGYRKFWYVVDSASTHANVWVAGYEY